jgi:hypothetical protein
MIINYNYEKAVWTKEEDDALRLQSFIVEKLSDLSLPNRTNAACKVRLHTLKRLGYVVHTRSRQWTDDEDKQLVDLLNSGCGYKKVSELMSRSENSLYLRVMFLRRTGVEIKCIRENRKWTEEKDIELVELINSGKRYKEIAEITGRSEETLRARKTFLVRKFQKQTAREK